MDFELFLTLRAKELVSGGQMLLTILGRQSEEMLMHGEIGTAWEFLAESLRSLVLQVHQFCQAHYATLFFLATKSFLFTIEHIKYIYSL
jgi:hypothetical protein